MEKKIYTIKGFDCANCAAAVERYLASREEIETVTLDFSKDKLFITYKESAWTLSQLKSVIKEVETDDITIEEGEVNTKFKIFTKDIVILLVRIAFSVLVTILGFTVFKEEQYYWVNFSLYLVAIFVISYDIFYKVIKNVIHKQNPLNEFLLISISSIGAFVLAAIEGHADAFMESTMVVTLFQVGKVIEGIAVNKSKHAINKAIDLRSEIAHLLKDNKIVNIKPENLKVGDIVEIYPNELVPIDGIIIEGSCLVDTSSLTGEFVPVGKTIGNEVNSGTIVNEGKIRIKVEKEYSNSTVSKLIDLISHSGERKSKADKFVTKFARVYTPIVFILSVLVAVIGGLITTDWLDYILLGLKMLVISCPCAIVISVPLAYFSALGLASKNGIVVKGSNYLDQLYKLKKVVLDKTGTLTKATFKVKDIKAINGDETQLIEALMISETLSNHPIAKAIKNEYGTYEETKINDFEEKVGFGVKASSNKDTYLAGSVKWMALNNVNVDVIESSGVIIYVTKNNVYLGYVIIDDEVKEESKTMVQMLKNNNIETIILSGDSKNNVKHISKDLGIDYYHYGLTPEQKSEYLEKEKNKKYTVAFVGDGVNDAACIKQSDVGFAMGGIGSDIAVNNADVVIMNDNPTKVYDCYKISKIARHTAVFNIICALFIKFSIELAAIICSANGLGEVIPMWAAVLADTGLTVILILNSITILYRKLHKFIIK